MWFALYRFFIMPTELTKKLPYSPIFRVSDEQHSFDVQMAMSMERVKNILNAYRMYAGPLVKRPHMCCRFHRRRRQAAHAQALGRPC